MSHPVQLHAADDRSRSRLTVFFRLLLAIPHLLWFGVWSLGIALLAIPIWIVALVKRRLPDGLHDLLARYVRYSVHVNAYMTVAANPFPGFLGEPRSYPVDVDLPDPQEQRRSTIAFRFFLAIPALLLFAAVGGGGAQGASYGFQSTGLLGATAVFAWFSGLFRARVWPGVGRLQEYSLHYEAQVLAYLLLVTDRYPDASPRNTGVPEPEPQHPVAISEPGGPLERSRVTVFFRVLLALPHFVWLTLWAVVVYLAAVINWLVTLLGGRSPAALHDFAAAFVRYSFQVQAFAYLIENRFPGFTGRPGSYPLEVRIAPHERQNRWKTGFRIVLAIPAFVLGGATGFALLVIAFLGWFAALATGRMPAQLRDLGVYALRYAAQAAAYLLLLTDVYPYSGPGGRERAAAPAPEPAQAP